MQTSEFGKKDLTKDALFWFFFILFLIMLAYLMLIRDTEKHYGALSFGTFPAFAALDSQGKVFNQHRLHGQLSVVVISDENRINPDILNYLHKMSQATATGKKSLKNLIFVKQANPSDQWVEYLTFSQEEFGRINTWRKGIFKNGVILIDQGGVIRGVFDLDEKMDRLNFEGAVRGII